MGRLIESTQSRYKVAAGANIVVGDQISINATGFAVPAPAPNTGVTGTVVGSANMNVNNTSGADGDRSVDVDHSCGYQAFLFPAGALTAADIGKTVYVGANPQSVSTTATNAVKSGTLQGIEDDGRARVIFTL